MKRILLLLAVTAMAVLLIAPAASAQGYNYCYYDGYYDDDDYYGYDYCGDNASYYPSYFAGSATASPTASATASPMASATATATASASTTALAATGGAPIVPAVTLAASLVLVVSGLAAARFVLRRNAS